MKILVTGNLGYIGPVLGKRIKDAIEGCQLIGLDSGIFMDCITCDGRIGDSYYDNQIYKDDPSKLKYYISESSDERIRAYQIKENQKIRLLKEQANVDLGGPQNILIVPETKQNNEVKSTIPIKKGGEEVSFVPFEPVNSVGTDILLHKLNQ